MAAELGLVVLDVGAGTHGGTARTPTFVSQYKYPIGNTHVAWRHGKYLFVGDEIFPAGWDADKAIEALMDGIRMSPLSLDLYADLGKRLERRGQKAEAERAWTTLVEVLPNEAASHRRLAEYREQRKSYELLLHTYERAMVRGDTINEAIVRILREGAAQLMQKAPANL